MITVIVIVMVMVIFTVTCTVTITVTAMRYTITNSVTPPLQLHHESLPHRACVCVRVLYQPDQAVTASTESRIASSWVHKRSTR